MSIALRIAGHELTLVRRDGRTFILLAIALLLGLAAAWSSAQRVARHEQSRAAALSEEQRTWANLGPLNPHSAAHFSHYAFRPQTALTAVQPGLTPVLGEAIWMEAHRQNPANFRPIEDLGDAGRFADLSPAWVITTVLPLLLIAAGHGLAAAERESGQWRLLVTSRVAGWQWLAGKGLVLVGLGLVAAALSTVPALLAAGDLPEPDDGAVRWLGMMVAVLLYAVAWSGLILGVSAATRSVRGALVGLTLLWMLLVVMAPRLAASLADLAAPVPTPQAFAAAIQADIEKGMDGHSPQDARRKAFEARVLAQYGVARVEDLPVSFAGLALQESERYSNKVFDQHYGVLAHTQKEQAAIFGGFGLASPAIALTVATSGLAGTDLDHAWHFARAAEQHRRITIARLNDDMAQKGGGKDFDYLAGNRLWQQIRYFDYRVPGLAISSAIGRGLLLLGMWALLAWLLAAQALRRWQRL